MLQKIVERKKSEVNALYMSGKAAQYRRSAAQSQRNFYDAISKAGLNLIAEIKRKSPSAGYIRRNADPAIIAKIYQDSGASAISVPTDSDFDGELSHLLSVSKEVYLPVLRKEFIIDKAQIYEARFHQADSILLIVSLLEPSIIREYLHLSRELGMECLVECHDENELEKAIKSGARILGINNRNLHDDSVDINTTLRLLPYIPKGYVAVTESGISTYEDVKQFLHTKINAMLVGGPLMNALDIKKKVYELLGK